MSGLLLVRDRGAGALEAASEAALAHRGAVRRVTPAAGCTILAFAHRGPGRFGAWCETAAGVTVVLEGWVEGWDDEATAVASARALAEAVAARRPEALVRLRGALSVAAVQHATGEVWAFRDACGLRPLFYWTDAHRLVLGSEVAAVLATGLPPRGLDPDTLGHLLVLGLLPYDRSLAAGVHKLAPGHLLHFRPGTGVATELAVRLTDPAPAPHSWDDAVERFRAAFDGGLERRVGAAPSVGLFLSGGIDSYLIGARLRRFYTGRAVAGTAALAGSPRDETAVAERFAAQFGFEHVRRPWSPASGPPTLRELLSGAIAVTHQPARYANALLALHLLRGWPERPGVYLSGDAADGLFGESGYRRMRQAELLHRLPGRRRLDPIWGLLGMRAGRRRGALSRLLLMATGDFRLFVGEVYEHGEVERLLGTDPVPRIQEGFDRLVEETQGADASRRYCYVHLRSSGQGFIDKLERLTASHGGDLVHPFLLPDVVALAFAMPDGLKWRNGRSKPLLRQLAAETMAPEDRERPKNGFDVPRRRLLWEDPSLRESVAALAHDRSRIHAVVDRAEVRRLVREFETSGGARHADALWTLLSTELWCEHLSVG